MRAPPLNILLVEDDEIDATNVRRALGKKGIHDPLYVARDGVEALRMLRGRAGTPPEVPLERRVVLLDINMPRMGGIELLQEMRSIPGLKSTPVIVLSASGEEHDRAAMDALHIAGYLSKPADPDGLASALADIDAYWNINAPY